MRVKKEIVDILSAPHSLQKIMRQGGGDSNRFSKQNVHSNAQGF